MKSLLINIVLLLILVSVSSAQDGPENTSGKSLKEIERIFIRIENGINSGNIDEFSKHFNTRTYISLTNGSSGYYSANQSYWVIKDFLSIYTPINFKLTNTVKDSANPFASGVLRYSNKGIRGEASVFISLKFSEGSWRISQITIN
jgi:hypothetical protein